ncbi:MAG: leucine-rich repeat domain-containing protein [Bacteroidales bacterium]|nr:leucine-rich repeat domain-containing protein [Bacteroidales bacterium]
MIKKTIRIFLILLGVHLLWGGVWSVASQPIPDAELQQKRVFTSLEEALAVPGEVYRLKLKIKSDSLPEEIFQLYNLQELTAARCKLNVLNQRIGTLSNLTYLNLSGNHLVRLPASIGQLTHLRTLIISRNLIEELPETISHLHQLTYIDAWENPLYTLPESISELENTLKTIDLRQIDLRDWELEKMEQLLPNTKIEVTSTCDCHSTRGK